MSYLADAGILLEVMITLCYTAPMTSLDYPQTIAVTVPVQPLPQTGTFRVDVNVSAVVHLSAEEARRKVNRYVLRHISHLMGGEQPQLMIVDDVAYWHVPVVLTYPSFGNVGEVGAIDVNSQTGELMITPQLISEIERCAKAIATRLPHTTTPTE